MRQFDVAIVGAGVAGLTAGMTCAQAGLHTAIIERLGPGGQIINAPHIPNWPGAAGGIAGFELGPMLHEQAEAAGAEFVLDNVERLSDEGATRHLHCAGETISARAIILAAGSSPRSLPVPGMTAYEGRGLSHCASCDGPLCRGKRVAVVGGGDAAFSEAVVVAQYASEVLIVYRASQPRAQASLVKATAATTNVRLIPDTELVAIGGKRDVSHVTLLNRRSGETNKEEVHSVFVYIGSTPNSAFVSGLVDLDGEGRILADSSLQTSVAGIFAAGDIRSGNAGLLASVAGEGATAARAAARYLKTGA